MSKLVSIVIPIYKNKPDEYEFTSLMQCINVLNNYDFSIVCPINLETDYYENLFTAHNINFNIQRFDETYFESIYGYNLLMLNLDFYERFKEYEFILIYQLDAYVFKDELKYWCSLNYDYIGAPWIEYLPSDPYVMSKYEKVGNGGFSLRRVSVFIERLNYKFPLKSLGRLWKDYAVYGKFQRIIKIPIIFIRALGYRNTMMHFSHKIIANEDAFWCVFLENTKHRLNIPDMNTASKFSVEIGAKWFYEENDSELPFGCHAWHKHEYDFWKSFIPVNETSTYE